LGRGALPPRRFAETPPPGAPPPHPPPPPTHTHTHPLHVAFCTLVMSAVAVRVGRLWVASKRDAPQQR